MSSRVNSHCYMYLLASHSVALPPYALCQKIPCNRMSIWATAGSLFLMYEVEIRKNRPKAHTQLDIFRLRQSPLPSLTNSEHNYACIPTTCCTRGMQLLSFLNMEEGDWSGFKSSVILTSACSFLVGRMASHRDRLSPKVQ